MRVDIFADALGVVASHRHECRHPVELMISAGAGSKIHFQYLVVDGLQQLVNICRLILEFVQGVFVRGHAASPSARRIMDAAICGPTSISCDASRCVDGGDGLCLDQQAPHRLSGWLMIAIESLTRAVLATSTRARAASIPDASQIAFVAAW